MGHLQTAFLNNFKDQFAERFNSDPSWTGGQIVGNIAQLPHGRDLRREGKAPRISERFEIGDLRTDFEGWTIIVEYESDKLSLLNLIKFWPFIIGELNMTPKWPILLCHFSSWRSYGTYRDYWDWIIPRIQSDQAKLVDLQAKQFDHGARDNNIRDANISNALNWIDNVIHTIK